MERLPWRFTMRRMSGALNEGHLHRAIALFLRNLELADGPILVVFALNERDWDADIGEIVGNIPGAEFWIEPGAVPAIEGVVDVRMPAREPLAEAGIFISLLDFGDRGDRDVLDYEMRGDQREAVEPVVRNAAGVDRSDRGAVGMAEQEPVPKADLIEQFWRYFQSLAMHIVERPRQLHRRGRAIARARIDEHAGAGRSLQRLRKISPLRG